MTTESLARQQKLTFQRITFFFFIHSYALNLCKVEIHQNQLPVTSTSTIQLIDSLKVMQLRIEVVIRRNIIYDVHKV